MKRILLATAALLAATAAQAADMAYKAAPLPMAAPAQVFSWTGFYIGVNAGIGGDKVDYPFSFSDCCETTRTTTGNVGMQSFGGFGGGQVGYNYQFQGSGVVLGVEADIQKSNIRSNTSLSLTFPGGGSTLSANAGTEVEWFGTVRGRLGYGWDRTLLYATGGYAYGSETTKASIGISGDGSESFSRSAKLSGWVAGGGIEYAFSPNVSLKTEYLYFDFGKRNVWTGAAVEDCPPSFIDNSIKMHTLKAGLNYRF